MKENKELNEQKDTTEKIEIPEDLQEVKIEQLDIDNNSNYSTEEEIKKDIKTNEEQMKKKVENILEDFDDSNAKVEKKAKIKNIFFIIGIIIEIIVIIFIFKSKQKSKDISNTKESYDFAVTCTNTTETNNYDLKATNIYYFDKSRNVAKTENETTYIFKTKEYYNQYKSDYISSDIKNFSGITQKSVFDDNTLAYKNTTIYNYNELKKNKKVKYKDNTLTLNIPNKKEPITIYVENYDTVLLSNENMGFICE